MCQAHAGNVSPLRPGWPHLRFRDGNCAFHVLPPPHQQGILYLGKVIVNAESVGLVTSHTQPHSGVPSSFSYLEGLAGHFLPQCQHQCLPFHLWSLAILEQKKAVSVDTWHSQPGYLGHTHTCTHTHMYTHATTCAHTQSFVFTTDPAVASSGGPSYLSFLAGPVVLLCQSAREAQGILGRLAGLGHRPFRGALAGRELPPPPWGTAVWRCSKPSSL